MIPIKLAFIHFTNYQYAAMIFTTLKTREALVSFPNKVISTGGKVGQASLFELLVGSAGIEPATNRL